MTTPAERYDAVIVGAGVAGGVAALRLAEAGMRVVCLEQGDWPVVDREPARPEYAITVVRDLDANPNTRAATADYPVDESDSDLAPVMWNGVGGSSVLFTAHWHRFTPSDFRVRTVDGVADDWPLHADELWPFYDRVDRLFGVSGRGGDPAFPRGADPPLPPVPLHRGGALVAEGMNRLGWHWWPGSNAIATRPYGELGPCRQWAVCPWGCPEGAKGSADITCWGPALRRGAELRTGARVARVVSGHGLARGVEYVDRDGAWHTVEADVTILAANGVGTPRLLLLSASGEHPDGLANSSGLVGRRLMLHPFATVVGEFDDDLDAHRGVLGQHLYSMQFYETDSSRGFVRGAKWGLMPTGGPAGALLAPHWARTRGWGTELHRLLRERFRHAMFWGVIGEDLPDASNAVTLHPTLVDGDGLAAPKVSYRLDDNARSMLAWHTARAEEALVEAGARQTAIQPLMRESAWHLMGTTVSGDDPSRSVVDRWGRTHDVENLYVFDSSTWPTSAGVNPAATIAAMALRYAEHLVDDRRGQRVPA